MFSNTLVTICWYRRRKLSVPYHCMSVDNSARLQPAHYNHYFKGKRPIAHILSLPLYHVTAPRELTKPTVVNMKCSTIQQETKACYNNPSHINEYPDLFVVWTFVCTITNIWQLNKKTAVFTTCMPIIQLSLEWMDLIWHCASAISASCLSWNRFLTQAQFSQEAEQPL